MVKNRFRQRDFGQTNEQATPLQRVANMWVSWGGRFHSNQSSKLLTFYGVQEPIPNLVESIPWNRILGSLNVYKFGLSFLNHSLIGLAFLQFSYSRNLSHMLTELAPLWSPDTPVFPTFENSTTSNLLPLFHTSDVRMHYVLNSLNLFVTPAPGFSVSRNLSPTFFVSFNWTLIRLIPSVFKLSFYSNPYFWFHPYPPLLETYLRPNSKSLTGKYSRLWHRVSYRPARLHITYVCLSVRQPYLYAIVDYVPKPRTKNFATGSWSDLKRIFA